MPRSLWLALASAALAVLLLACRGADGPAPGEVRGTVTVFAAASLTDAFQEIGRAFEASNAGTRVVFNFGGTPTLRTQLEQGARADVFAAADLSQMELAERAGLVKSPRTFASNVLVVVTPRDNPGNVSALADLARPGLKLVVTNEEVPAGAYTRQMLSNLEAESTYGSAFRTRVLANVVSLESNVRQVVSKVELGEADAGVVYGSDVTAALASRLHLIEVPTRFNVSAEYPIAILKESRNRATASAFVEFILSAQGQSILKSHGFAGLD